MSRNPRRKLSLIEDTERLVHDVVRDARKRRKGPDGKPVAHDFLDRCRAVESALKFLQVKERVSPEETESEFERNLKSYHGEGSGDAADQTGAPFNGSGSAH